MLEYLMGQREEAAPISRNEKSGRLSLGTLIVSRFLAGVVVRALSSRSAVTEVT